MNKKDNLGDRIKDYENCYRLYLPKRQPVIIRCDMRAGHSFTKGFARPYDEVFAHAMWETTKQLCENVSGCKFALTQSDEITLILTDYENINTEPWFGNNLQKIVSITASMATFFFNKAFTKLVIPEFDYIEKDENLRKIQVAHLTAFDRRIATFDSRTYLVPREEIFNVLYWRQLDCKRNSIQLLGQSHFSHKQLQNKNSNEIQEMLWQEKGINWADEPKWFKNGVCVYKVPKLIERKDGELPVVRYKWKIDTETPVFTQNRDYINKHFTFKEEL